MQHSETVGKLFAALAKAQAKMPKAPFNAKNTFLKNEYADLGSLIETSKPVLAEFGLSIIQLGISDDKGRVGIETIVGHESGEWISQQMFLLPDASKGLSINQTAGVTMTYLKRYNYAGAIRMFADADNDGEVVVQKTEKVVEKERVWSIDQMETVIAFGAHSEAEGLVGGLVSTHEEAKEILNHSNLPESADAETINRWLKVFTQSKGDTTQACALDANKAYAAYVKNHKK